MKSYKNILTGWLTAALLFSGCAYTPPAAPVYADDDAPHRNASFSSPSSVSAGTQPVILVRQAPAMLLKIDGPPQFQPVRSGLDQVVNAAPALFYAHASRRYYLAAGARWLSAAHLNGPWFQPEILPAGLPLPVLPTAQQVSYSGGKPMNVMLASPSAYLVLVDGLPRLEPVDGADLKVMVNASQAIYYDRSTRFYYLSANGRWFRSRRLESSWTPSDHDLPQTVARFSAAGPAAVSSYNISQKNYASPPAAKQQTLAMSRGASPLRPVQYQGTPAFKPIPGTKVAYGANTDAEIFVIGEQYYRFENEKWYAGASAYGPWAAARSVPDDLYELPPTASEQEAAPFSTETYRETHSYDSAGFGLTHVGIGISSCGGSSYSLGFGGYPYGYAYPSFMFGYRGWGRHWGRHHKRHHGKHHRRHHGRRGHRSGRW